MIISEDSGIGGGVAGASLEAITAAGTAAEAFNNFASTIETIMIEVKDTFDSIEDVKRIAVKDVEKSADLMVLKEIEENDVQIAQILQAALSQIGGSSDQ